VSLEIRPAATARDMRDFLRLPFRIYRRDPNWVPPVVSEVRRVLDPDRNPYFAEATLRLLIGYRDGTPVCRTAVIVNRRHERKFGIRAAFFGFFESANDVPAARRLFEEAEKLARAEGAEVIEGPFNPTPYSEVGLQIDGFETPPRFFQPYNPPYYSELLFQAGFRVATVFQTMKNEAIKPYLCGRYGEPGQGPGRRGTARGGGYTVRDLSLRDLPADLERVREVNNDAFADNWHFLPLSREEVAFSAKHLSLVTRPGMIKIVEHQGRPAGVLHCVLDVNPALKKLRGRVGPIGYLRFLAERKKTRRLIVFTVAIRPEYRRSRVYVLLLNEFRRLAEGFDAAESTWVSTDNPPSVRAAESLGMVPDKRFAVYEKRLRP
jgi:hypothetical protein